MWQWLENFLKEQEDEIKKTNFPGVVVGKVLSVNKHPNADRLQIAMVDIGNQKIDIVCGGPNLAKGQLVPVALVGTKLANGLEIKEAEIRGSKSNGMICAEDELGLSNKHETIIVLDEQAEVGEFIDNFLP